mgnify:CR=1 FL=1
MILLFLTPLAKLGLLSMIIFVLGMLFNLHTRYTFESNRKSRYKSKYR